MLSVLRSAALGAGLLALQPASLPTAMDRDWLDPAPTRSAAFIDGQAASATDVQGWDPARWGMTEADVIAAFKGKAQRARRPRVVNGMAFNLAMSGITFATLKGTVDFGFAQADGQLRAVTFTPEKEYWDDFEIIERHLIATYGPSPREQDPPGSVPLRTTVFWRLPASSIELLQMGSREPGRKLEGMVMLRYATRPAQK